MNNVFKMLMLVSVGVCASTTMKVSAMEESACSLSKKETDFCDKIVAKLAQKKDLSEIENLFKTGEFKLSSFIEKTYDKIKWLEKALAASYFSDETVKAKIEAVIKGSKAWLEAQGATVSAEEIEKLAGTVKGPEDLAPQLEGQNKLAPVAADMSTAKKAVIASGAVATVIGGAVIVAALNPGSVADRVVAGAVVKIEDATIAAFNKMVSIGGSAAGSVFSLGSVAFGKFF